MYFSEHSFLLRFLVLAIVCVIHEIEMVGSFGGSPSPDYAGGASCAVEDSLVMVCLHVLPLRVSRLGL